MGYGGIARRLAIGAGAGLCGLGLMAFALPIPVPSVTPTAPVPLPSIPALLSGSSGSGSQPQQPSGTQAGAPPASTAQHGAAAGVNLQLAAAPVTAVAAAADGPLQTQAQTFVAGVSRAHLASVPTAAGGSSKPPSGGLPVAPTAWLLAAFAIAFALLMVRIAPLPRRSAAGLRLEVTPSSDAALEAAMCLCESMLPDGASVRRAGSTLRVAVGGAARAELDAAIAQISRRAHRVGLGVEPATGSDSRPQLAPA